MSTPTKGTPKRRGAGIPWDQPGSTPYEDLLDFAEGRLQYDQQRTAGLARWAEHQQACEARGLDYLDTLKAWAGSAVLGDKVQQVLRNGFRPAVQIIDEVLDFDEIQWAAADVMVGGAWLEFCAEPVERL